MGLTETLSNNLMGWVKIAILIVVSVVVLIKFKSVSGVDATTNTTIDTFTSALAEPANWVVIVIVALIGFYMFKFFKNAGK